jgi:NADH/NAD ratio-sensing transcriptional regulator Rex
MTASIKFDHKCTINNRICTFPSIHAHALLQNVMGEHVDGMLSFVSAVYDVPALSYVGSIHENRGWKALQYARSCLQDTSII